ncbi:MAG: nicotinate-nucleotide--dimethylbenzimidazole phosphoribosyltransferase [Gammaproteobacteria bacterium (ex Lamellibrachia satsuma)]|nr:MAG: nicotinate-nucleotide--dimethylbenzimidazole phosphoribosyltransferase [Gammaproteobacteria bacterium (ex Lamellibrachia satsuma)]RRS33529.1 MAG: nicotinate-nucleotide--dimethylbenzimidazole phosphoribosyltransferase [Gammaproteobacteria bacterium (ex Lamellibrachia satsuma)]RRS34245.1 MAG: nicotinate-nucleotide--dimethylbenzimidazole phosphoribosyltransferase [Gammaproteobacteria bacterium (ex Lamellibrachia satsuma)]
MKQRYSNWVHAPAAKPDAAVRQAAESRQAQLTKPPGALGQLETIAIRLAGLQGSVCPTIERVQVTLFAGDHGVVAEGVSAFPQAVTLEMVHNFARGGAAICVLARELGATLEVINLGTVDPSPPQLQEQVTDRRIAAGTANFTLGPAMTQTQLQAALDTGREAIIQTKESDAQLFIGGEMGIGNTTSASALACALLNCPADLLAGPGTGLGPDGVSHKVAVIEKALKLHRPHLTDPLECLRRLGGFEIAALTGSYLSCAQQGLPVVMDGFIAGVAALIAIRFNPDVADWCLFSHASAEPGHKTVMQALQVTPLLDLGMRLGEGSGAAVAVPLLRLACALHADMATFGEAGVSEKDD